MTIRSLATAGRTVIVGRGGVFLTKGLTAGVHVRLTAPMEYRVQFMMHEKNITHGQALIQLRELEHNRNVFLKTNYYIQSLQPGDVTPVYLEDPQTKCFFFVKLAEKAEPEMSTMSAGDYHQNLAQLRQQKEAEFLQRYRYGMIARRTGLQGKN